MNYLIIFCTVLLLITGGGNAAGFTVQGTKLYDAKNNEFIMRGVNYAYAWFTGTVNQSLPAIAKAGANAVRIVLADGAQWSKTSSSAVSNLIKVCEEQKMIAVLEVHDATGKNDEASLLKAANFFVEIKSILQGKEDKVIINIANEWYGSWNVDPWASGASKAIKVLRDAGFTHTIMIDGAGYGQYPKSIHDKGKAVLESDPLKNTMFSIHMYEYAGGNASTIKSNIDKTLSQDLCLCIGEFGVRHKDGDVDEQYILDYCQETGVGWLAWSWNGNSSDLAYLDLSSSAGTSLTGWGNTVVNGRNGLKETSEICSVFGNGPDGPAVASVASAKVTIGEDKNNGGTYSVAVADAPAEAVYTVEWQSARTETGTYKAITGAAAETYEAVAADDGRYLRCVITGKSPTTGSKTSNTLLVDLGSPVITGRSENTLQPVVRYQLPAGGGLLITVDNIPAFVGTVRLTLFDIKGAAVYRQEADARSAGYMRFFSRGGSGARNELCGGRYMANVLLVTRTGKRQVLSANVMVP